MKTKKPVAIIYNWNKQGEYRLQSQIYHEESLYDEVIVFSMSSSDNTIRDVSEINPDLIISFGSQLNLDIQVLKITVT